MSEFEQNLTGGPRDFAELSEMIESGEGEITPSDLRRLAETEEVPQKLKAMVMFAADLIEERDKWGVDTLTELMAESRLNRTLEGAFERSKKTGETISVVLYDLDKLKEANLAGEGHEGGDKLIQAFAQTLSQVYNPAGVEFRTGIIGRWKKGDEFLVAIRGKKEKAVELHTDFLARIKNQKLTIGGKDYIVGATGVVKELNPSQTLKNQLKEMSIQLIEVKKQRDKAA